MGIGKSIPAARFPETQEIFRGLTLSVASLALHPELCDYRARMGA